MHAHDRGRVCDGRGRVELFSTFLLWRSKGVHACCRQGEVRAGRRELKRCWWKKGLHMLANEDHMLGPPCWADVGNGGKCTAGCIQCEEEGVLQVLVGRARELCEVDSPYESRGLRWKCSP